MNGFVSTKSLMVNQRINLLFLENARIKSKFSTLHVESIANAVSSDMPQMWFVNVQKHGRGSSLARPNLEMFPCKFYVTEK